MHTAQSDTAAGYAARGFHGSLPGGQASGVIQVTASAVTFTANDNVTAFPIAGLALALGGAHDRTLYMTHPQCPGWSIYTDDLRIVSQTTIPAMADIALQLHNRRKKHRLQWALLGIVVLLTLMVPVSIFVNIEMLSRRIASSIPAEWERELGSMSVAQYQAGMQVMQSDSGRAALAALTEPLIAAVNDDRYTFEIAIADSREINAFALPGGFIVLNAGLILEAEDASEVLGVLAHEIAHVTEQHGLRNIISTVSVFILADVLLGDISGLLAVLVDAAPLLISQRYSREYEAEADRVALTLLERANVDPAGLIRFFERLMAIEQQQWRDVAHSSVHETVQETLTLFSTHPATEDRIRLLRDRLEAMPQTDYKQDNSAFLRLKQLTHEFMNASSPNVETTSFELSAS